MSQKQDDFFYEDYPDVNARLGIKVKEKIFSEKSKFQKIEVYETESFGKLLLLDNLIMLTEKDEFIYHEMIAHVPINVHPNPQRLLVIGAGDGGTMREILKHPEIKKIDLVEIDQMVADVSKKFFPEMATSFSDERVTCFWEDGVKFVGNSEEKYDLIIIDSTDPFGPGEGLFTSEFYQNCFNLLSNNGILVNQSESPQWTPNYVKGIQEKLSKIFPIFKMYQAFIPTYPSGHWLFSFASKTLDPIKDQKSRRWEEKNISTKYYNPDVHAASFALPNFVLELFEKNEE